jgi:hypothetical protein
VQQKTFTKWINHHLVKGGFAPVKNLYEDLQDGHKLLGLLEVLTNQKYVRITFPIIFLFFKFISFEKYRNEEANIIQINDLNVLFLET